jgi:hypothetical protein
LEKLADTARTIYCFNPKLTTKKEEVFFNFKMSVRGAIRQAPNVIQWCLTLKNLNSLGENDATALIKEWNTQSSKAGQLTGGKYNAVKQVLVGMPIAILTFLENHISLLGWGNCAYSDDSLSNKKVYPGHIFKSPKPGWADRVVVTERSMLLHVMMTVNEHMQKVPNARRKYTKKDLEEGAQRKSHRSFSLAHFFHPLRPTSRAQWLYHESLTRPASKPNPSINHTNTIARPIRQAHGV